MKTIRQATIPFCEKDDRIGLLSYFGSFAVYFATLLIALNNADVAWVVIPMVVINAFAGVRLYVLQHDCGHRSLFDRRDWNDWAGYALSTFTLTPYKAMQVNHNTHHAHLGNLEERDSGEIHTMTLREWNAAGFWTRLKYRIYRNPAFLLPFGGAYTYLVRYRWPKNAARIGALGVMAHNAALVLWLGLIFVGWGTTGLSVWLATALTAGVIGVFLVFLQHNFEDTWWDRKPDLSIERAALQGSSALDLGWWWDLGTCNIAYHDLHHFNPRIPSYRLRQCHRALRGPYELRTIEWPEAIRSFRLKLWDEDAERLVPFPGKRREVDAAIPAE